jgi:hypothetical protein
MSLRRLTDTLIFLYFVGLTATTWTVHPSAREFRAERRIRLCTTHLRELQRGLLAYHRDHGKYPEQLGMLYPRYVRHDDVFTCPSAMARIRQRKLGYTVDLGGKSIASAYLLAYLSSEHEALRQWRGGMTPLVICDQHVQDITDEA